CGAHAGYFISSNRYTYAASTYRNAPIYLFRGYRSCQRHHDIGIIVCRIVRCRTIIVYRIPRFAKLLNQPLLMFKTRMIGRNSYLHWYPFYDNPFRVCTHTAKQPMKIAKKLFLNEIYLEILKKDGKYKK